MLLFNKYNGDDKNISITITDLSGKELVTLKSEVKNNRYVLNTTSLKNGSYILNVVGNSFSETKKLNILK